MSKSRDRRRRHERRLRKAFVGEMNLADWQEGAIRELARGRNPFANFRRRWVRGA